jgi:GT2 family glycosyltransferase
MSATPTVSIVMPAYNAAEYIEDAIHSALAQTYRDLEIVVVDDGSTDNTRHLVSAIGDARIRYIHQANAGQSAAINHGAELATGQYIKILDADDWISPPHIAAQVAALKGDKGCVASCRWGYFINNFQQPVVNHEVTNASYDDPLKWMIDSLTKDEGMMGGWMWLIPRHLWQKAGGYDTRLSLNNDFHFTINLLLQSSGIRHAADAVYSYRRIAGGSLSGSRSRKAMESAFLTTELGTQLLLRREDSERVRKICADRFQERLFEFYPAFPDLASQAQNRIQSLGGSTLQLQGGRFMKLLRPVIGWKGVRRIQQWVYRCGWQQILKHKTDKRLAKFN